MARGDAPSHGLCWPVPSLAALWSGACTSAFHGVVLSEHVLSVTIKQARLRGFGPKKKKKTPNHSVLLLVGLAWGGRR